MAYLDESIQPFHHEQFLKEQRTGDSQFHSNDYNNINNNTEYAYPDYTYHQTQAPGIHNHQRGGGGEYHDIGDYADYNPSIDGQIIDETNPSTPQWTLDSTIPNTPHDDLLHIPNTSTNTNNLLNLQQRSRPQTPFDNFSSRAESPVSFASRRASITEEDFYAPADYSDSEFGHLQDANNTDDLSFKAFHQLQQQQQLQDLTPSMMKKMKKNTTDANNKKIKNKLGYQRSTMACTNCRHRKIRCLVADKKDTPAPSLNPNTPSNGRPAKCANCQRLNKDCDFKPVDLESGHTRTKSAMSLGGNASDTGSVRGGDVSFSTTGGGGVTNSKSKSNRFAPYSPARRRASITSQDNNSEVGTAPDVRDSLRSTTMPLANNNHLFQQYVLGGLERSASKRKEFPRSIGVNTSTVSLPSLGGQLKLPMTAPISNSALNSPYDLSESFSNSPVQGDYFSPPPLAYSNKHKTLMRQAIFDGSAPYSFDQPSDVSSILSGHSRHESIYDNFNSGFGESVMDNLSDVDESFDIQQNPIGLTGFEPAQGHMYSMHDDLLSTNAAEDPNANFAVDDEIRQIMQNMHGQNDPNAFTNEEFSNNGFPTDGKHTHNLYQATRENQTTPLGNLNTR